MIHISEMKYDTCGKCRAGARGVTFRYLPGGVPTFYCLACFQIRLADCLLTACAMREEVQAHAEMAKADLADY